MGKTLLMKVGGNKYVNHSFFRPYLYAYDDMLIYTKRHHIFFVDEITIPYNQIAMVNHHKKLIFSKLEFVLAGAGDSVTIKGIWNRPATRIKKLIDDKIYHEHNKRHFKHENETHTMDNIDKTLHRFKELLENGRISEREYEKKKKELLSDMY